jgi:hypothetical protein
MFRIFSTSEQKFLDIVDVPKTRLRACLVKDWKLFFPDYELIATPFELSGIGLSGVDMLAYSSTEKKFVVLELAYHKSDFFAADYQEFIHKNFAEIYLQSTQIYGLDLPKFTEISKNSIIFVRLAQSFTNAWISRAKSDLQNTSLGIKYLWLSEELLLLENVDLNRSTNDLEAENASPSTLNEPTARRYQKKHIPQKLADENLQNISEYFADCSENLKLLSLRLYQFLKSQHQNPKVRLYRTELIFEFEDYPKVLKIFKNSNHNHDSKSPILYISTPFSPTDLAETTLVSALDAQNKRLDVLVQNNPEMEIFLNILQKIKTQKDTDWVATE